MTSHRNKTPIRSETGSQVDARLPYSYSPQYDNLFPGSRLTMKITTGLDTAAAIRTAPDME